MVVLGRLHPTSKGLRNCFFSFHGICLAQVQTQSVWHKSRHKLFTSWFCYILQMSLWQEFAVAFLVASKTFQIAAAASPAASAVTWQAGFRLFREMTNVVVPTAIRSSAGLWPLCLPSREHRRRAPAFVLRWASISLGELNACCLLVRSSLHSEQGSTPQRTK